MRCLIIYKWTETSFSGGSVDFGVRSLDDPKVEVEKQKLLNRGMFIQKVIFY